MIGFDELPEQLKQMLVDGSDGEARKIRHEMTKRQEAQFWDSLTFEQMLYLARMLSNIEDDEDGNAASRHLGTASAYLMMRFKSCACGEKHRDPDEFMQELVDMTREKNAADEELAALKLARVPHHPMVPPSDHGKFHCTECGTIFDSVEARKEDAVGSTHNGCVDSSD
ncbi:hypothetical protein ACFV42_49720 [Streptomyces solisilvae]|uniref:hypothetical protein n=1 Tax=Streptomyces malaysiensis TaxID=92644 RepID=UPI0036B760B1